MPASTMRLATLLPFLRNPRSVVNEVASWERAGLEAIWVAEAWGYDSPTVMGYLAARTERMLIGSAVLNLYSRSPALIAQTAVSLDALSEGRALLGLGVSGPQVVEGWHGQRFERPLARTREVVDLCRRIWQREVIEHQGIFKMPLRPEDGGTFGKPLKLLAKPVRDRIPIYLGAQGRVNVALTSEIADGWLPPLFIPDKASTVWGEALAQGKQRRDPALGPLEIAAGMGTAVLAIGEDAASARDQTRPVIAFYVGAAGAPGKNFYYNLACEYGYEREASLIQEHYLAGRRREAEAAVPAEFCQLVSLAGTAGYVRERIEAFREAGVTMLVVTPVGPDPLHLIEQVREWL
jgi:F420-dependent oxidoreductase-like protein